MSGTNTANVDAASDRAFRSELNAFLDKEAAAERRAEEVIRYAKDLTAKDEEYDPWTFDHFEEAMGNAPEGERKAVFCTIAAAADLRLMNDFSNRLALVAIRQLIERYWLNCALQEAETRME